MPYFPQGAIIPTDTRLLLFSMRMDRKAAKCYELIVTEECGLPEEFPTKRFTCIERESWCGSRRVEARAYGPANKRTGSGFGNNGVTCIEPRSAARGVGLRPRAHAADSQVLIRIVFQEEARGAGSVAATGSRFAAVP